MCNTEIDAEKLPGPRSIGFLSLFSDRQIGIFRGELSGMTERKTLGVAVFGCGRMGSVHVRHVLLSKRLRLIWVVDENLSAAEKCVQDYDIQDKVSVGTRDAAQKALKDDR